MRWRSPRGFTLSELLVTLAVIGVITAIAMPMMLSALRAAAVRAGAEEMASALSEARQMAVRENRNVCVTLTGDLVEYRVGGCAAPVTRQIRLTSGLTPSSTGDVVFNYLGAATPPVTYTVTDADDRALRVEVLTSGRVRIQS